MRCISPLIFPRQQDLKATLHEICILGALNVAEIFLGVLLHFPLQNHYFG